MPLFWAPVGPQPPCIAGSARSIVMPLAECRACYPFNIIATLKSYVVRC